MPTSPSRAHGLFGEILGRCGRARPCTAILPAPDATISNERRAFDHLPSSLAGQVVRQISRCADTKVSFDERARRPLWTRRRFGAVAARYWFRQRIAGDPGHRHRRLLPAPRSSAGTGARSRYASAPEAIAAEGLHIVLCSSWEARRRPSWIRRDHSPFQRPDTTSAIAGRFRCSTAGSR